MTYYHLPSDTARNPGRVETKLSDGARLSAPDGRWTDELAALCGFVRIVDTVRPADTDTHTHERTVEVIDGTPTVVWTERAWTEEEVQARLLADAPDITEVVAARLVAADNANPPLWFQPTGAHDAWLPGAIVLDESGDRWQNTLTVPNVWAFDVIGWVNLDADEPGDDPQPWVQPTGAHDAYPAGAVVTHNGQTWVNTHGDGNVWEPGAFGWTVV